MKSYIYENKEIKRKWHVVDARNKTLGRLSVEISSILIGKNKAFYSPHQDLGDYVVVINAKDVKITGKKYTDKIYYRYTGYPGGLRSSTWENKFKDDPRWAFRHSIKGMLPSNKLRDVRLKRLKVYLDEKHPYVEQVKEN